MFLKLVVLVAACCTLAASRNVQDKKIDPAQTAAAAPAVDAGTAAPADDVAKARAADPTADTLAVRAAPPAPPADGKKSLTKEKVACCGK